MNDHISEQNMKSRFAGHYLLQNATVIRAAKTVEDARSRVNRVRFDDLVNLLYLLEATVASSRMYYDATTGGRVTDELAASERILEKNLNHPTANGLLDPAKLDSLNDRLDLSVSSIQRVSFKLDEVIASSEPPNNGGFNLNEYGTAVEKFSHDLFHAPEQTEDLLAEALRILDENSYRGSKCVAAILGMAANETKKNRKEFIEKIKLRFSSEVSLKDRSRFQSALMNDIFRPTFLPALADQVCNAAFLGNERAAKATAEYNRSYINYAANQFLNVNQVSEFTWKLIESACCRDEEFPWLGLMTFLSANADDPDELLDYALALRKKMNTEVNTARTLSPWHLPISDPRERQVFIEDQYQRLFRFGEDFQSSSSHPVMVALGLPPDILSGILTVIANLTGADVSDIPIGGDLLETANNIASEIPGGFGSITDHLNASAVDGWITRMRVDGRQNHERDLISLHSEMKLLLYRILETNGTIGRDIRATCERTLGAEIFV